MANKGHTNRQKRISYNGRAQIKRKEHVWTFNQNAGAHSKETSATLGSIIRDVLKIADNAREIKYIMQSKTVLVNGRRVKDYHFSLGLFDILEFKELEKRYRVFLTHNNVLALKEMGKTERLFRPCRVVKKTVLSNDKVQIGFENGFNLLEKKGTKTKVGDSVEFDVSKQKFADTIVLKENARVYIVGGPHVSKIGTLKNIVKGDVTKANEVTVESDGKTFKTMEKYVFAIPEEIKL
jgi:small subunit ribosomal protein S4e